MESLPKSACKSKAVLLANDRPFRFQQTLDRLFETRPTDVLIFAKNASKGAPVKQLLWTVVILGTAGIIPAVARAETPFPMVMSLQPVAARQGETSEHELESRYSMFGARKVFVSGEGVTGEIITPMEPGKDGKTPSLTKLKLRLAIAPDALPGIRDLRLTGPTGPSTLAQVLITPLPVVKEQLKSKNNSPEQAQPVTLPVTLCGTIETSEDVDYYRFHIDPPQRVQFHCLGMRLEDRIHDLQTHVDPIITIRDAATGNTVAAANNNYAADPLLSHQFTRAGDYLLEVRDVRFQGNKYWTYAIEISPQPFVTQVYPLGISPQTKATLLTPVMADHSRNSAVNFQPRKKLAPGIQDIQLPQGKTLSNPVAVVVSNLPIVMEANTDNNTASTAQTVPVPCGINGRIESASDIDCYRFAAKKGDRLTFESVARRNGSDLDSMIRILKEDGTQLSEVDDMRLWGRINVQDSCLDFWAVPADGNYVAEIRDVHLRGGPGYVYFLKIHPSLPEFELGLDSDRSWITPGSYCPIFVRAVKKNGFQGDIQLHIEGLPSGVIAHCGRIQAGSANDGCILLSAPKEAPLAATNVRIYGTATVEDGKKPLEISVEAQPLQETYMPGGGRSHFPVAMHTVAIGAPSDILAVKISEENITLKPGETKKIDVEIQRAPGFATNVTLDMLMQHLSSKYANTLPQGVTIDTKASKMLLTGSNSKGSVVLKAAKDAPAVDHQLCCVMANVSVNFVVKVTTCSPPLKITVTGAPAKK